MKNLKLALAAMAIAAVSAPIAHAVTADGTGTANIVAPLAISNSAGLRFGDIAPNVSAAGVVTIATDDTKTCAAALTCFTTSTTGAAAFTVSGFSGAAYDITVPATVQLDGQGPATGQSMSASLTGSKASGTLVGGTDSFTVGGALTVGANQAVGAYSGTFTVTVEYQ